MKKYALKKAAQKQCTHAMNKLRYSSLQIYCTYSSKRYKKQEDNRSQLTSFNEEVSRCLRLILGLVHQCFGPSIPIWKGNWQPISILY